MLTKVVVRSPRLWAVILLMGLAIQPQASASDGGDQLLGSVKLAWDLSWEPIAGYRVHYGLESGNYTETVDVGYQVQTEIEGLPVGTTYFSAVTAYNAAGLESGYSNEISFTVLPLRESRDTDGDGLSDLFEETAGGDLEPFADLDVDGMTAFAEYAHGLDPLTPDRSVMQIGTSEVADERYMTVRYLTDPLAERFVNIHVERSLDLTDPNSWQRGQTVTISATVSEEYPDLIEIVARSLSPISSQPAEYLRFSYEATTP